MHTTVSEVSAQKLAPFLFVQKNGAPKAIYTSNVSVPIKKQEGEGSSIPNGCFDAYEVKENKDISSIRNR